MSWYKKAQQQTQAPQSKGDGWSAQVTQYSNKGPLIIITLSDGSERRCYLDLLTGKWKPLD